MITYTPQEAYDKVAEHLLTQRERCAAEGPCTDELMKKNGAVTQIHCFYRHPRKPGMCCGIGALIPDEIYTPDMEYKRIGVLLSGDFIGQKPGKIQKDMQALFNITEDNMKWWLSFLHGLQTIHDCDYEWETWASRLNCFATMRHLKKPQIVIDTLKEIHENN